MRTTSLAVARAAGVSRTTVSMVLNGVPGARISSATRAKVLAAAKELGYTPNVLARSLKTKKTHIIGLIVPSITNPFFPAIAQGVEDVAVKREYNVFFCNSYRNPAKEKEYVLALCQKQVEGVIFAGVQKGVELAGELKKLGIAAVLFDRVSGIDVDTVAVDNVNGAMMAARHLILQGRKRIAFLSGPLQIRSRVERWQGYRQALQEGGLEIDPGLLRVGQVEYEEQGGIYELKLGYILTRELIERRIEFDGIFAVNDMTAVGALKALREVGWNVPDRAAVVGFDNLALAALVDPPLTTVTQPQYEMGMAAADLLFARLADPRKPAEERLFRSELVVRESSVAGTGR